MTLGTFLVGVELLLVLVEHAPRDGLVAFFTKDYVSGAVQGVHPVVRDRDVPLAVNLTL